MGGAAIAVRAGSVLVGEGLDVEFDKCIWVRDGYIESIEGYGSCPQDSIGGGDTIVMPQTSNAHVHSADNLWPEMGVDQPLRSLVSQPQGLKHRLLETVDPSLLVEGIRSFYTLAWRLGTGLLVDFREGGGAGCRLARKALDGVPRGLEVILLGRPGPGWPEHCDGLGLSSVVDYSEEDLRAATSLGWGVRATHIAEEPLVRAQGDLDIALKMGFNVLVHGTHLSSDDLELVKSRGASLVMCPRSNMWHGVGLPPIDEAIKSGVRFALGTDNAAWTPPDIMAEAYTALLVARLRGYKGGGYPILKSVLIDGYRIFGREPRIVEEGRRAYFIIYHAPLSGIRRSRDPYSGIIKRVGTGILYARVDGGVVSRLV